jgi:hypothetical protein
MNEVLRPFLRRFVLVFFDYILIYNKSWLEHLQHVHLVFFVLQAHKLFMKRSKCAFECQRGGIPQPRYFQGGRGYGFAESLVQCLTGLCRSWCAPFACS